MKQLPLAADGSAPVSAFDVELQQRAQQPQHQLGRAGDRLRYRLGETEFQSWFGRVYIENHTGKIVRLAAPSKFIRDWLFDRYCDVILDCFHLENPAVQELEIVVRKPLKGS